MCRSVTFTMNAQLCLDSILFPKVKLACHQIHMSAYERILCFSSSENKVIFLKIKFLAPVLYVGVYSEHQNYCLGQSLF